MRNLARICCSVKSSLGSRAHFGNSAIADVAYRGQSQKFMPLRRYPNGTLQEGIQRYDELRALVDALLATASLPDAIDFTGPIANQLFDMQLEMDWAVLPELAHCREAVDFAQLEILQKICCMSESSKCRSAFLTSLYRICNFGL